MEWWLLGTLVACGGGPSGLVSAALGRLFQNIAYLKFSAVIELDRKLCSARTEIGMLL
jgi:hypothetical protein